MIFYGAASDKAQPSKGIRGVASPARSINGTCSANSGLYALQGVYDISPDQPQESLRQAVLLINAETGVDSGNRADEEQRE